MKPDYKELKYKYKKEIYEDLLLKKKDFEVQKTWALNKEKQWIISENSYSFLIENIPNKDITDENFPIIIDGLKKNFHITNQNFNEKAYEVCSGSGDEKTTITTLHSSSLCALLFFYGISPENKLTLNLNGHSVDFDEVHFEYQNHVISPKYPSNIDIVLLSHSTNSVLFLESKFSEYLYVNKKSASIGKSYRTKFFSEEMYTNEALSVEEPIITVTKEEEIVLTSNTPLYLEGFKQMISHYIGLKTLSGEGRKAFVKDKSEQKKEISNMVNNGATIYLGEILFDNFEFKEATDCLKSYKQLYKKFVSMAKRIDPSTKINLLNQILVYSEIKNSVYKIDSEVLEYYFPD